MAEQTAISWTDHTWNPWIGCQKVAPGCEHCYAEAFAKRTGQAKWGPQGTRRKTSEAYWKQPLKWNRKAETHFVECENEACRDRRYVRNDCFEDFCPRCGDPAANAARPRVFCASMADVFEDWQGLIVDSQGRAIGWVDGDEVQEATMDDVRRELFALIDQTPHLDWLLLTKRPENVRRMWPAKCDVTCECECHEVPVERRSKPCHAGGCYERPNVWLGTSVSDQATADRNVPKLLECRDLCPVLFLSCEPLLGPIDFDSMTTDPPNSGFAVTDGLGRFDGEGASKIDWVIVGGESGHKHRPMELAWAASLREQCRAAGVPFFFKQIAHTKPGQGADAFGGQLVQQFPVGPADPAPDRTGCRVPAAGVRP